MTWQWFSVNVQLLNLNAVPIFMSFVLVPPEPLGEGGYFVVNNL
jgi:hypothetical protein